MVDLRPANASTLTAAVILAAGRGTRMGGGMPKQYRSLSGIPVLARSIGAFDTHPMVSEIVVVRHSDDDHLFQSTRPETRCPLRDVGGGATRDASVRAGLAAVSDGIERVLIHDAARPLVNHTIIDGVLAALDTHDGAAPALAVTDALWRGEQVVSDTVDRAHLWRAQTPQGFHINAIRAAHAAHPGGSTDDVAVAHAAGLSVAITPGAEINLKLTQGPDFARAEKILREQMLDIRTGNGFDVHRFGAGDHVMLCGIAVPHTQGLQGHSDADVGLHALTDAIYGALAAGDIGTHFPANDPRWKGADSGIFITHAVSLTTERGFVITHADLTLICEAPKIGPHTAPMRERMAALLRTETSRVSVKATTTEKLGFAGRGEGIAALATVTLMAQ